LLLTTEKSAPRAPKAPPIDIYLAVPPGNCCEYRRASTAVWAKLHVAVIRKTTVMNKYFFILFD
jgi:hypothetical protein